MRYNRRVFKREVASVANYIISGDRHLLKLKAYAGTPILTVRRFLGEITSVNRIGKAHCGQIDHGRCAANQAHGPALGQILLAFGRGEG
jgi:hypothetical protein